MNYSLLPYNRVAIDGNQKMNAYKKGLCKQAGIDTPIEVVHFQVAKRIAEVFMNIPRVMSLGFHEECPYGFHKICPCTPEEYSFSTANVQFFQRMN